MHQSPKDIHCARIHGSIILLITINTCSSAGFAVSADHKCVPIQGDRTSKEVADPGIRGFEICPLHPRRAAAHEHIGRASLKCGVVLLVTVDPGGGASLFVSADCKGI